MLSISFKQSRLDSNIFTVSQVLHISLFCDLSQAVLVDLHLTDLAR